MALQFSLPKRRPVAKFGIERAPQRIFPRHRRFVKSHCCVVPGCDEQDVDFAHVKTVGSGGDDSQAVSLCRRHHSIQHALGIETFQIKYGVDLWAIAAAFVRASPDTAMRESLRLRDA
jgi:hypothetical protein